MGGYGSGGLNRTHGQVENHKRIDSFHLQGLLRGDKYLYCKEQVELPIHSGKFIYSPRSKDAAIKTNIGHWIYIELSFWQNISQVNSSMFFLCPSCGKRVRYLYMHSDGWECRKCAKLNYASQQKSGIEEMIHRMEYIVERELQYYNWRRENPHTMVCDMTYVPKPPYMRWKKYNCLMDELRTLQRTVLLQEYAKICNRG